MGDMANGNTDWLSASQRSASRPDFFNLSSNAPIVACGTSWSQIAKSYRNHRRTIVEGCRHQTQTPGQRGTVPPICFGENSCWINQKPASLASPPPQPWPLYRQRSPSRSVRVPMEPATCCHLQSTDPDKIGLRHSDRYGYAMVPQTRQTHRKHR